MGLRNLSTVVGAIGPGQPLLACGQFTFSRIARNVGAWTNVGRADVAIGPYHGLCGE